MYRNFTNNARFFNKKNKKTPKPYGMGVKTTFKVLKSNTLQTLIHLSNDYLLTYTSQTIAWFDSQHI